MSDVFWISYGPPLVGIVVGGIAIMYVAFKSWQFANKYETTGAGIHERGFADGGAGGATPSRGAGLRARITGTCRRSR